MTGSAALEGCAARAVALRGSVARTERQRNPGSVFPLASRSRISLRSIRATKCWRNNQHKTFSRRDLRPSYAHGGEWRIARSPDERSAKSGAGLQARKPLPDFTEPVIGPATSGRTRWFHPGHERKGGGTPADAYLQPPHPQPSSSPLAGKDRGGARRASGGTRSPVGVPPRLLLRVCPDTLGRITKFSKHEPN